MALLIRRLQTALARERHVAQVKHELAVQKTTLINTVSHEFRTPLTVIEGVAKTLVNLNLVAEEGRPLLEGLNRATAWLDELVMGLLAAGGALGETNAQDRPMSLETVCREIAQNIGGEPAFRRLRPTWDPEAASISHHHRELRFVVRTVIDNALKFSPEGSPVDIRSRRVGDQIEVRVGDRGPGVTPDFLERAFVIRIAAMTVLVVAAPLVLVGHATPQSEGWARAWWRALFALLVAPVAQSLLLAITFRVVLTNDSILGLPVGSGFIDVLVVGTLIYFLYKVPIWCLNAAMAGAGSRTVVRVKAFAQKAVARA